MWLWCGCFTSLRSTVKIVTPRQSSLGKSNNREIPVATLASLGYNSPGVAFMQLCTYLYYVDRVRRGPIPFSSATFR